MKRLPVSVAVLGPTMLSIDDDDVALSRTQVRRALTFLAARAPDQVSLDELVDFLWPDRLPNDPRSALAVIVSRLRSSFGDARDTIVTNGSFVGLGRDVEIDVVRFARLCREGGSLTDPGERVVCLESALALWRGTPFGADGESAALAPIVSGLDELRWQAAAGLLEAAEVIGDHQQVVSTGGPLHHENPGREPLTAPLARSLLRLGRRSDALAVLDRTRRWLRDELGINPSQELTTLEKEAVGATELVGAAGAESARVDEHVETETFVGRDDVLLELPAAAGQPCVLVGEAGAGKSAVLREFGRRLEAEGRRVLHTTVPVSPERPAEPIARIIESIADDLRSRSIPDVTHAALARLAPGIDLGPHGDHIGLVTRDVLVREAAAVIVEVLAPTDGVVVIDDHHQIDALSNEVMAAVVERGCSVVAGARPVESRARPEMSGWEEVRLGALALRDAERLLADLSPSSSSAVAAELWSRSGGNALFLRLLIDVHVEGDAASGELPPNVLVAIQQRLTVLSSSALATIQLLSVFGVEASVSALRELTPTAESDLDEAVAAHLVRRGDDGWVAFDHALVRDGAHQMIAPGRRVVLHEQVGETLAMLGAHASEYVRHFDVASEVDPIRAATAHRDAALEFESVYSWDDVEHHGLSGLSVLAGSGGRLEAELAVLVGRSQRTLHRAGANDALLRGIDVARESGDVTLFADAVIALATQNWSMTGDVDEHALGLLEEALGLDLLPEERARVLARAATLVFSEHHERAREMYHEGLDMALELDDVNAQAEVLRLARWGLSHPADLATLIEVNAVLDSIAGDDVELCWGVATNHYAIGSVTADPAMVADAVSRVHQLHDRLATTARDWEVAHIEASAALLRGDLDAADAQLDRAFELALATSSSEWVEPIYGACLVSLRRAQGRLTEVLPFLEQALDRQPDFTGWRAVRAGSAAAAGDLDLARRELDRVAERGFGSIVLDQTWTGVMTFLSDAAIALDDRHAAAALFDLLVPYSGRMAWSGVCTVGSIDASLAGLAGVAGRADAAADHQRIAAEVITKIQPPAAELTRLG